MLGSGGMGTVFRAFDRQRRRPVALKVMNRAGGAAILRFKHEFRTLLGVAHPNLVTLYELIFDGNQWLLTMELLDGVSFLQYVRDEAPLATGPGKPAPTDGDDVSGLETEVIARSQPEGSAADAATDSQRGRLSTRVSFPGDAGNESTAVASPFPHDRGPGQVHPGIKGGLAAAGSPGAPSAGAKPLPPGARVRFAPRLASSPRGSRGCTRRGNCIAISSPRT